MLHWLDLDEEGLVRMADAEGNFSKPTKIFSGKAIETFEQSPTKSVSGGKMESVMAKQLNIFTTDGREGSSVLPKEFDKESRRNTGSRGNCFGLKLTPKTF